MTPRLVFQQKPFSYIPALDGLRAVAVMAVIFAHAARGWLPGGWLGVNVFFVLSGFLITSLLLNELTENGRIELRKFYVRRALRLLPALGVLCATLFVASFWFSPALRGSLHQELVAAIFYFYNYSGWFIELTEAGRVVGHFWTLSVEEQFYIVWPFLLAFAYRRLSPRGVLALTLVFYIVTTAVRFVDSVQGLPGGWFIRSLWPHGEIMVGCSLALAMNMFDWEVRLKPISHLLGIAGALLLGLLFFVAKSNLWSPLADLGTSFLVLHFCTSQTSCLSRWASNKLMVSVGRMSYGLYLWHVPVIKLTRLFEFPDGTLLLARLVLTFLVAWLSYKLVEEPALRLKKRFTAPGAKSKPLGKEGSESRCAKGDR